MLLLFDKHLISNNLSIFLFDFTFRKVYWVDEGGYGVPQKIGKVNMDGTNPIILVRGIERPIALTFDIDNKLLYYSTEYPATVS